MMKTNVKAKITSLVQRKAKPMSKTLTLEDYPRINPLFTGLGAQAKDKLLKTDNYGVSLLIWIILIVFIYFVARYIIYKYWLLETPANIRCQLNMFLEKFNKYGDARSSRMGLRDYIKKIQAAGVPDNHLAITNFLVSSSNTPAFFTPIRDGIASPDAIRLTLAAGARYLDFSIWGDGKKNNYRPMLKGMDAGSNWRRITMTEMTFSTAMDNVAKYGFANPRADSDTNNAPYAEDPLFIMLRFNGKYREQTFTQVANILRNTIEANRLDFTYNKGRGMEGLFKVPITQFFNKVIILSNVYPPENNILIDYINIGPRSAVPLDMSSKEIYAIPLANREQYIQRIQQNFTISRTELEEPYCDQNINSYLAAHGIGIHFSAINFWSEDNDLKGYLSQDVFGKSSFLIKPLPLRYIITYIKPPLLPNPELNARDGKPRAPPGIQTP